MKTHLRQSVLLVILLLAAFVLNCKKDEPTPFVVRNVTPTKGMVGEKVVIVGTGFSTVPSETVVMFGEVSAIIDSITTTRIVTSVPQGAKTGKLVVRLGDKTLTSSTDFIITVDSPVLESLVRVSGSHILREK
jgi:PBP1b-binding outer membrane lipoprotein LpoB